MYRKLASCLHHCKNKSALTPHSRTVCFCGMENGWLAVSWRASVSQKSASGLYPKTFSANYHTRWTYMASFTEIHRGPRVSEAVMGGADAGLYTESTRVIRHSTVVLQCYRRQAIPMKQAKLRPSVILYSLDRSLSNMVWLITSATPTRTPILDKFGWVGKDAVHLLQLHVQKKTLSFTTLLIKWRSKKQFCRQ